MEYGLERVVDKIIMMADADYDWGLKEFSEQLLENIRNRPKDKFVAYRKVSLLCAILVIAMYFLVFRTVKISSIAVLDSVVQLSLILVFSPVC